MEEIEINSWMTLDAIKNGTDIPFTSIILFDGTPHDAQFKELFERADYAICIKDRINSLPHIWNMMFTVAKLTRAKYLYWQGSDMELKAGSMRSMCDLITRFDVVSPIKIDNDRAKFESYKPENETPLLCAGMNDSAALFKLSKMSYSPFDEAYAPYQFETSDLGYRLWRSGCTMVIDPKAVVFHHVSKDIEHSPKEREHGSKTWDEKRDHFMHNADNEQMFFLQKSIMNSEIVKEVGFPVHIYGPIDKVTPKQFTDETGKTVEARKTHSTPPVGYKG